MSRRLLSAVLLVAVAAGVQVTALGGQRQRAGIFEQIKASTDIAWLEAIAGDAVTAERITPEQYKPGPIRALAYTRLGAIGTADAIAAVRRVEVGASSAALLPGTVDLENWPHPAPHVSTGPARPFVTTVDAAGGRVGLIATGLLGGTDAFVVRQTSDGRWSRPLLVPQRFYRGIDAPSLTWKDPDTLVFRFVQQEPRRPASVMSFDVLHPPASGPLGPQEWTIDLREISKDSDADGWTDAEEARLQLHPRISDTDGDGIPDGRDVCPNFSPVAGESGDEDANIVKRAAFATYGLSRSRFAIFVRPGTRPVQLFGFRGPVLYNIDDRAWMAEHDYGYVFLSWKVSRAADTAVVTLDDYEAPLAAAVYRVTLKKIGAEWVVVELGMAAIS